MTSVYNFLDYQDWLKAFLDEKKANNSHYSLRKFATQILIDPSLLAKVISKKRHLSKKSLERIKDYLKLDSREYEYLLNLVKLAKAKDSKSQQKAYEVAISLRKEVDKVTVVDEHVFYSEWYNSAIRNLLQIYPFYGKDFRELGLQLRPKVSAKAARDAIATLLKLDMIEVDETGRYVLTNLAVTSGEKWKNQAVRNYHKLNIELGKESIERFPATERDISGVTMNIGKEDLEHIRGMIRDFRKELIDYVNVNANPEQIYHLNLQFFPMSEREEPQDD